MWPFKSKYQKLKREDVVDAICNLEKQQQDIETGIIEKTKDIEDLLEKGKVEKNNELKKFYAKKIMNLKEECNEDVKRGMYLLYNIRLMKRLKSAIDDNSFFANTGKVSLGNLLGDQKGLAKFLNKALNTKVKSENVLTSADDIWNEIQSGYVENEQIYGVNEQDDQLLAIFENADEVNSELGVDTSSNNEREKQANIGD